GMGALAATVVMLLWPIWHAPWNAPPHHTRMFNASVIPVVDDATRRDLASYPSRPDFKALAISDSGWYVADGAPDLESAKQDALKGCGTISASIKSLGPCTLYAVGTDVVWSEQTAPLPAPSDIRIEPTE